jgi:RNA-binding protein MEX3
VVTGRKEDVASAKREILSAAEHFSQIRAQRKNNLTGTAGGPGPNAHIPGQTTIQVRVPYRVVGLVVGPKGATIKRIQQQTNTYIITPSRDKEPIFEVTGLPDSVETAKKEIEAHIAMRTGGVIDNTPPDTSSSDTTSADPFARSSSPDSDSHLFNPRNTSFSSLYRSSSDAFSSFGSGSGTGSREKDIFSFGLTTGSKFSDLYSSFASTFTSGSAAPFTGLYESDEGIGDSPTFSADSIATLTNGTSSSNNNNHTTSSSTGSSSAWPDFTGSKPFSTSLLLERKGSCIGSEGHSAASSSSSATTSTSPAEVADDSHLSARRLSSDALTTAFVNPALGFATGSTSSSPTESLTSLGSLNGGPTNGRKNGLKRDCIVCFEGEIQAALIPCGHNLFW